MAAGPATSLSSGEGLPTAGAGVRAASRRFVVYLEATDSSHQFRGNKGNPVASLCGLPTTPAEGVPQNAHATRETTWQSPLAIGT